jgi:hypothetical protein
MEVVTQQIIPSVAVEMVDYEAVKAEAKRRADLKAQYEADAAYAQPVAKLLRFGGSCAVVLFDRVDTSRLFSGLRLHFGDEHIHEWDADGNVHGEALQDEAAINYAVSELDKLTPDDVLILGNVDFRGRSGEGTPAISQYIARIVTQQGLCDSEVSETGPMILAVGKGTPADVPTSDCYDRAAQAGITSHMPIRVAVASDRPPTTIVY